MFKDRPGCWLSEAFDDILGIIILLLLILAGTGLFFAALIGIIKFNKWLAL